MRTHLPNVLKTAVFSGCLVAAAAWAQPDEGNPAPNVEILDEYPSTASGMPEVALLGNLDGDDFIDGISLVGQDIWYHPDLHERAEYLAVSGAFSDVILLPGAGPDGRDDLAALDPSRGIVQLRYDLVTQEMVEVAVVSTLSGTTQFWALDAPLGVTAFFGRDDTLGGLQTALFFQGIWVPASPVLLAGVEDMISLDMDQDGEQDIVATHATGLAALNYSRQVLVSWPGAGGILARTGDAFSGMGLWLSGSEVEAFSAFTRTQPYTLASTGPYYASASGDYDGDQLEDAFFARSATSNDDHNLIWLRRTTTPSNSTSTTFVDFFEELDGIVLADNDEQVDADISAFTVGDIDRDGDADLFATQADTTPWMWLSFNTATCPYYKTARAGYTSETFSPATGIVLDLTFPPTSVEVQIRPWVQYTLTSTPVQLPTIITTESGEAAVSVALDPASWSSDSEVFLFINGASATGSLSPTSLYSFTADSGGSGTLLDLRAAQCPGEPGNGSGATTGSRGNSTGGSGNP